MAGGARAAGRLTGHDLLRSRCARGVVMSQRGSRAAFSEWLLTGAGPWVTAGVEVEPGDVAAFRRQNESAGVVRVRRLVLALLALNWVGWVTDPWLLHGRAGVEPALGEGRFWISVFGLALVAATYWRPVSSRVGANVLAWVGTVGLCVGMALTMGRIGGPSTAWFHYMHVVLFVTLLAWASPLHRVGMVAALWGVLLGGYFGVEPGHLADPLAGSAVTHVSMVAALVLVIGLRLDHGRLRLFLFTRSAERASVRLEARVAEQTVRIQGLLDHVAQAREDERRDLAAELHDEMGQVLTGMRLVLKVARGRAEAEGSGLAGMLGQLGEMLQQASWTVRNLLVRLRPRVLDDLGLAAAAEWLAERTDGLPGVSCGFTSAGVAWRLSAAHETAVFRVLQEALTNAVRHGGAGRISVGLGWGAEGLVVSVEDDGRGFVVEAAAGGLGIVGMEERARVCGGRLAVRSAPGRGTRVELVLPSEVV